jgi:quercetin dioxygenase-like cupin family protein
MATHSLDALRAAADHHELLFENDRVRILDTCIAPGERTPVHAHEWPAALYVLSWCDFVRRDAEGKILADSRDRTAIEAGSGLWIEPLPPHSVENVGTTELRIVAVEVKS